MKMVRSIAIGMILKGVVSFYSYRVFTLVCSIVWAIMSSAIKCVIKNLKLGWSKEEAIVTIPELELTSDKGLMLPLMGKSGGGKSTLMMVLAALKWPLSGSLSWHLPDEQPLTWGEGMRLSHQNAARLRSCHFGFVFQRSTLSPDLTIRDNLLYPQLLLNENQAKSKAEKKTQFEEAIEKAKEALCNVFIDVEYLNKFPHQLSGGQQQRVALAQAIIHEPQIIFADEPTGNLDPITREEIMAVLMNLAQEKRKYVIWVTHHGHTDLNLTKVNNVLLVNNKTARLVSQSEYYDWEEKHKSQMRKGSKK
jgi:putative ABC transport system ATP-binding protein